MVESKLIQFLRSSTRIGLDFRDLGDGVVGVEAINPVSTNNQASTKWKLYYDITKWRPIHNGIDSVRAVPVQIGMIGGGTLYKVKMFEDLIKRSKELLNYTGTNPKPWDY